MRKLLVAFAAIVAVGFAIPATSGPAEAKHSWNHHRHHHGMKHHNNGRHLGWARGRHRGWAHSHHRHH
jgi:Ni/Co efflux regulator RcnB